MKNPSSSPPVHVHVSDSTPVHVHVKSLRTSPSRTAERKTSVDQSSLRPTAEVRTGSWTSAGRVSLRDMSSKKGPDPEPEPCQSALHLSDLTSEEDQVLQGRIGQYQRRVHRLRTEVRSLRNQVEQLNVSKQVTQDQEEDLDQEEDMDQVTQELRDCEQDNSRLLRSMDRSLQEGRPVPVLQPGEVLLRKLLEAEAAAAAAAQELSALRVSVNNLLGSGPTKLSSVLTRQEELLLQKLKSLEETNRSLRHLLREQQESQVESSRLEEQKNRLVVRLAETRVENSRLQAQLQHKDTQLQDVCRQLDSQQEKARSTEVLTQSLQAVRARLQARLRSREAESDRLRVQIKNLRRAAGQQEAELDLLTERLAEREQEVGGERAALKRAARAQKDRAQRSQDSVDQLRTRLIHMDQQLAQALSAAEDWRKRHEEELKLRTDLQLQLDLTTSQVSELAQELQRTEVEGQVDSESLLDQLKDLTSENTAVKLENRSLKSTVSSMEDRLSECQSELLLVRSSTRHHQDLLESYRLQVQETWAEADEYRARLAQAERESRSRREELEQEVQEVRRDLLGRLEELEALPEELQRSQLLLKEAQDQEDRLETWNQELSRTLSQLRTKVETQESQMDLLRQKKKVLMEENRQVQQQVQTLERKLEEACSQNSELLALVASRDKVVQDHRVSLEDRTRECCVLSRRLNEVLEDARQQVSETRDRGAAKEHSSQSKILDLETQLSRTTSEIQKLKRSKEEVERRYQSQVQDLKDRLEQSDSTNQSLQNYVQFLKTSYSNMFSDRGSVKTPYRPLSPI